MFTSVVFDFIGLFGIVERSLTIKYSLVVRLLIILKQSAYLHGRRLQDETYCSTSMPMLHRKYLNKCNDGVMVFLLELETRPDVIWRFFQF